MGPEHALPFPNGYNTESDYVDHLLDFVSSSDILQLLVGGVHILDFFTRSPDLYQWLLPQDWRLWFELHDLQDLLDFFLREDLSRFIPPQNAEQQWRGKPLPPSSLVSYLSKIRSLSLRRGFESRNVNAALNSSVEQIRKSKIPHLVAVGMKEKKIHEVDHFARYVHKLAADVEESSGRRITHVVDFGSGQNYLGRTLASPPYSRHVVAVESRHANVVGAKAMDVHARLAPKAGVWRNKKEWRAQQQKLTTDSEHEDANSLVVEPVANKIALELYSAPSSNTENSSPRVIVYQPAPGDGSITYVEHMLEDGNLESVIDEAINDTNPGTGSSESSQFQLQHHLTHQEPNLMVISLHSCGNLTHHGLRALTLNPAVSAVALVGCCYNLLTERLTTPSYKLPNLRRPPTPSEPAQSMAPVIAARETAAPNTPPTNPEPGDPHGFPMSARLATSGIALNITARMMAVQAPHNWTKDDSARFFRRHFYRALLQRIFVDRGVVQPPADARMMDPEALRAAYVSGADSNVATGTGEGRGGATQPVVIGSLRKACYTDFVSYVRGAVAKLAGPGGGDQDIARLVHAKVAPMEDAEICAYAEAYAAREKDLSVVWSLMALSATLVEAVVVVDRWLWLREQMGGAAASEADGIKVSNEGSEDAKDTNANRAGQAKVSDAWVESVFDYSWSPRNLVVVGIKGRPTVANAEL